MLYAGLWSLPPLRPFLSCRWADGADGADGRTPNVEAPGECFSASVWPGCEWLSAKGSVSFLVMIGVFHPSTAFLAPLLILFWLSCLSLVIFGSHLHLHHLFLSIALPVACPHSVFSAPSPVPPLPSWTEGNWPSYTPWISTQKIVTRSSFGRLRWANNSRPAPRIEGGDCFMRSTADKMRRRAFVFPQTSANDWTLRSISPGSVSCGNGR